MLLIPFCVGVWHVSITTTTTTTAAVAAVAAAAAATSEFILSKQIIKLAKIIHTCIINRAS